MGKSIKANDENGRTRKAPRNNVAYGMIASNQGHKQVFGDRREKRKGDRKNSWQNDHEDNG
jgi:hypothetical protein